MWIFALRNNAVSDYGQWQRAQHDRPTEGKFIRENCDENRAHGCDGIRDHSPELSFVGIAGELQVVDDGGEEKPEGVQTAQDSEVGQGR